MGFVREAIFPSPPRAQDPEELIRTQGEVNRINQITPFGSLTFTGPNRNTATQTLSPELQRLLNQQIQVSGNSLNEIIARQNQLNTQPARVTSVTGAPLARTVGPANFSADARRLEEATFDRATNLLNPIFQEQEETLRQRLADTGNPIGSELFQEEFDLFNDARNRAFTDASLQAVQAGRQEQSRLFGQDLARAGFQNQAAGQLFNQNLTNAQLTNQSRDAQLNELLALQGLQQVQTPGLNSFFAPSQLDVLNPFALQESGIRSNFDVRNQRASDLFGGIFGLGSASILAACSKDFKEELGDFSILDKIKKLPLQVWRYKGESEPHFSMYAEDFKDLFNLGDGKFINLIDAVGILFGAVKELDEKYRLINN
ncbi:MAG: hypothetical protein MJA83_15865 [Gammaproteobacteria bacterium]|nr:hypothetical protein [Gammaproteobacteria bacterium]